MRASPKMCKSAEVIGSSLRFNDLGISTLLTISIFHFSHLSLIVWGNDSSHEILYSHISLYNIFPIKCAGDINPVGLYIFCLVS